MKDEFLMTDHKLHWHLDRVNDWLNGKPISPIHIELGVNSSCNLDCYFCFGNYEGRDDKHFSLPKEIVQDLFDDCKEVGVKSITLASEGENTLHPDFYDIIKYGKDVGLDLALLTNGTALNKKRIDDLVKSMVYIRFSISASNREKFEVIQGRDLFDKAIENIKATVEAKNRLNLDTTIGMMMVLTDKNIDDVVPLTKIAKDIGVDYFVVKPCSEDPERTIKVDVKKYLEDEVIDILKEAETYTTDNFDVIIKYDKLSNLGVNQYKKCHGTNFSIAINSYGNVAPCGSLFGYRSEEFHIGNILESRFKDIVFSQRYIDIQKKVLELDVNKECETNCLHHKMNIYLDKLKSPPKHINFV